MTAITAESTMLFEYGGFEDDGKGKYLHYFTVFDTPTGRIEATIYRGRDTYASPSKAARQNGASRTAPSYVSATAKFFDRENPATETTNKNGSYWRFVAALGENECLARNVEVGDVGALLDEDAMNACRADAARVTERALLILGAD